MRGRAERVRPDALELFVLETSDPALVPKRQTRVPRELVTAMTVKWKTRHARALLTPALAFGLPWAIFAIAVFGLGVDSDTLAPAGLPLMIGGAILGYLLGNKIDTKRLRVIVEPGVPSGESAPHLSPNPAGSRAAPGS